MSINAINLDPSMVSRLTEDPALYVEVPYLVPMKDTALMIHKKLPRGCSGCHKGARAKAWASLTNAFGRLTIDEAKKTPNGLHRLRNYIQRRFALKPGTPITLQYTENGKDSVLNL